MILDDFVSEYNHAPYEFIEFARGAVLVTDNPELKHIAQLFLDAHHDFENLLLEVGVEIG